MATYVNVWLLFSNGFDKLDEREIYVYFVELFGSLFLWNEKKKNKRHIKNSENYIQRYIIWQYKEERAILGATIFNFNINIEMLSK